MKKKEKKVELTDEQKRQMKSKKRANWFYAARFYFSIIYRLLSMLLIFLPFFMKYVSYQIFELSFEEFITETRNVEIALLFTVYFISGGVMFFSGYQLSILGICASVASIIITHTMYSCNTITIILSLFLGLGILSRFVSVLSLDLMKFVILAKWCLIGFAEIVYIVATFALPTEFESIRILFIAGSVVYGMMIVTMFGADDEIISIREIEQIVGMYRIGLWNQATDHGRHEEYFDSQAAFEENMERLIKG